MATTRWEMPKMKPGYTVIDLSKTGSQTSWTFKPDQDVLFIGSTTTRTLDRIYVNGGHNVAVVGGKYEPTGGSSATIHLNGLTGNAYIEGVHIDHRNAPSKDGIGVAGAKGFRPNVYVQNTIIDGITGTQNGVHGDIFQRYGQLGDIKMYNLSGSTNYQGLFLNPDVGYEIRSVELENIDIVKLPGGDARTWTYYFYSPGHNKAYPISLKNVYSSDGNVFPPPGYAEGAVIKGDMISFPNKAFSGHMKLGRPDGGDLVKAADIGIGYKQGKVGASTATKASNDTLDGSWGADVLDGGAGFDWLDYSASPKGVTVHLGKGTGKGGWAEGDVLRGIEAVSGTKFADKLTGSGKVNKLHGGDGNDTLDGRAGADTLVGGRGNDRLLGGGGNDVLSGGQHADVLSGGTGNDRMTGGAGNDRFVIRAGDGADVVTDFDGGAGAGDQLRLVDFGFRNFADVKEAMTQVGKHTVIDLGHGDSVKLLNVSALSLAADDFVLG